MLLIYTNLFRTYIADSSIISNACAYDSTNYVYVVLC